MGEGFSAKKGATILLAGVSSAALVSYPYSDMYWVANFIHHSALAATVGGLADWWGVTSLFHKPFGINSPGTDVLRKNYDRIIDALTEFICSDLLSAENIIEALRKQNLIAMVVEHFRQEKTLKELCDVVNPLLVAMLKNINLNRLEQLVTSNSSKYIETFNLYGIIIDTFENAIRSGKCNNFLGFLIRELQSIFEDAVFRSAIKNLVLEAVKNYKENSLLRKYVDFKPDKISDTILRESVVYLKNIEDSTHPMRKQLETFLLNELEDNRHNRVIIDWINKKATELFNENVYSVKELLDKKDVDVIYKIAAKKLGEVSNDPILETSWDESLKNLLQTFIETKHEKLYEMVHGKLTDPKYYDKDSLINTIEEKVGSDLQSIRISGTIIGGFAGAVLFLISTLVERICG